MLLAGLRYASAQENTSAKPYIDSWHLYRVSMGNTAHTYTWQLFDNLADAQANTNVDYTLTGAEAWANTAVNTGNAEIEIKFIDANFNGGQTWYLVYSEWDNTAGTGNCIARRSTQIDIVDNSFNLIMAATATDCNSYSDTIFDNADGVIASIVGNVPVPFSVVMEKANDFRLSQWSFTATATVTGCTLPGVTPSVVLTPSGAPAHGTLSFTGTGASFTGTVTGISTNPADDFSTDGITFNIVVNGHPTDDYVITLDIVGTAQSGTNYTVSTGENDAADNKQVNTIYGIPNTSLVSVTP